MSGMRVVRDDPALRSGAEAASVSEDLGRLLGALPGASLVVAADGRVVRASARAEGMGLVHRDRLAIPQMRDMASRAADDGEALERDMRVRRPPLGRDLLDLRVRAMPVSAGSVVILAEDLSEERRVDAVRRDFIANVSHELKTPVGALSLLAEAGLSASDDPEEVRRFATRMQAEAERLGGLVNDIIDLTRLQGDDPLSHAVEAEVHDIVLQATEEVRSLALSRDIEIVVSSDPGPRILADRDQVVMARRNLLANALAYSPAHTRVAIAVGGDGRMVTIDVKDQGIGIPAHDLDRIFERFYRVDPARSRGTGGTGLGLAIVKHVCQNHGGDCRVWSEVGVGSTFTLAVPLVAAPEAGEAS
ncbi:MAG: sensor histidine kinase [bacterium]